MSDALTRGRMKDGTVYTGNQQFAGGGVQRFCPICGTHKPHAGGHIRMVLGLRSWVCSKHPKVAK